MFGRHRERRFLTLDSLREETSNTMKGPVAACLLLLSLAHGVWSGCPEVCTLEYAPVCGSNGVTYSNECFMEYASCKNGVAITKKHDGMCDLFLAKRQTDECPSYAHQHICTLEYAPVCASNGKTYPNLCQMCAYMYEQQEEGHNIVLTVDYHGVCKTAYKTADFCTTRDTTGICTREYDPICGTDGKTYGNRCTFCYEQYMKQENGEELAVDHEGECSRTKRDAFDSEIECLPRMKKGICTKEYFPICGNDGKTYGNKCTFCYGKYQKEENGEDLAVNHFGECQRKTVDDIECGNLPHSGICTEEYFPVCGSDGKTHANKCMFCYDKYQKEQNGEELTVDHFGECHVVQRRSVDEVECLERYNTGVCTREYFPVCGSDGKTYANKCTFCYAKSQNGGDLTVDHFGVCAAIEKRSVEVQCLERYNTGVCTREYFPVCGSDGKTYANKCTFCYAKSQNGGDLTVDHFGVCAAIEKRSVDEVQCLERYNTGACTREYFPICGSDGKTYGNKCTYCFAKHQKQQNGEELTFDHFGACAVIEKRSADIDCPVRYNTGACTREYFPICGSDGKTYGNKCTYCFAKHQKQQNGEELSLDHVGECAVIAKRSADDVECLERYNTGVCTREYFPICGSDGKTYGNKCTFCYAKSQNGADLSVDHFGTCKPKHNCPESSKQGICTLEYAPVCANNGQTYSNECAMCADMYRRQQQGENVHIHVEHTGVC